MEGKNCPVCGSNNVRQMSKFNVICTLLIIAGLFFLVGYLYLKFLWIGTALFLLFAFVSLFNRGMKGMQILKSHYIKTS